MAIKTYNYWAERIDLKEKIEKEIQPKLDKYVGKTLTEDLAKEINKLVNDWFLTLNQFTFSCQISIDVDNVNGIDTIANVEIYPFYF